MARKGDIFFPDRIVDGHFVTPQVLNLIAELEDKQVEVCIRERRDYGGLPHHRYYRGRVIALMGERMRDLGNEITDQELHKKMARLFLVRTVKNEEGHYEDRVTSTADLSVAEFAFYIDQVREWARENLDLDLPDPETGGDIRVA